MRCSWIRVWGVLLLGTMLVGCSKSPYEIAPVHGAVSIDGKPLTGGKVMFAPIAQGDNSNPGKPAFGKIQSDGTYTLTTLADGDGAVVGEHWVTILDGVQGAAGKPRFERLAVPTKQNVAANQENAIDFQLTSQQVAQFAASGK